MDPTEVNRPALLQNELSVTSGGLGQRCRRATVAWIVRRPFAFQHRPYFPANMIAC